MNWQVLNTWRHRILLSAQWRQRRHNDVRGRRSMTGGLYGTHLDVTHSFQLRHAVCTYHVRQIALIHYSSSRRRSVAAKYCYMLLLVWRPESRHAIVHSDRVLWHAAEPLVSKRLDFEENNIIHNIRYIATTPVWYEKNRSSFWRIFQKLGRLTHRNLLSCWWFIMPHLSVVYQTVCAHSGFLGDESVQNPILSTHTIFSRSLIHFCSDSAHI